MTIADYAPFCNRMIDRYEGGYGWNRHDPGGPTKYGITCYDLAEYLHTVMNSMAAWAPRVAAMTLQTADMIYATKYATACAFNELNVGSDCVVFDFGVNSGPTRSIKYAQIVVGFTDHDIDGVLGAKTLAAINARDPVGFVDDLCTERLRFLRSLSTWGHFGVGWTNRVTDLRSYSVALINKPAAAVVECEGYRDKIMRIPLAFAKGYAPDDLQHGRIQ